MRKPKHRHKKETRSLSEWREVRNLFRYNRAVSELIKAFREQLKALVCTAPF